MVRSGSASNRFVKTQEFRESNLRAAAEIIDGRFGQKGNHRITDRDIDRAGRALRNPSRFQRLFGFLQRNPLQHLPEKETDILRQALPTLQARLHQPKEAGPRLTITSIPVDAIGDPTVRQCATRVAELFASDTGTNTQLNVAEVRRAQKAWAALQDGHLQNTDPELAHAIQQTPSFTQENLDGIMLFMQSGKGGLLSHPPISVGGIVYEDVYRFPGEFQEAEKIDQAIDSMESLLDDSRYDRIYVMGSDRHLYLALNPHGALDRVQPGYRVQLGTAQQETDAGTVVRVVDVINSMREATIGFWSKLVSNTATALRTKLLTNLDRHVAEKLSAVPSTVTNAAAARQGTSGGQSLFAAGLGLASFGAALFNWQTALGLFAGGGLLMTGINLWDYLRRQPDKAPILHGLGVAVNRSERIAW